MVYLNIKVFTEISDPEIVKELKKSSYPQNIIVEYSDITITDSLVYPNDGICLIITDREESLKILSTTKNGTVRVIFVGKHSLDADLLDVWYNMDPKEMCLRLERLIVNLGNEFNFWFYEHTLYTAVDTVPDIMWIKRLDGIHMMVNTAFTKMVHKTRVDIIGRDHYYIWDAPKPAPGEEDFACGESEEIAIKTGKTYICDELVKTRHGMKQLTTYKTPIYDMFGNIYGTLGVGHDCTNFSNMGIELSLFTENIPFPMVIFDPEMKVVRINAFFLNTANLTALDQVNFDYNKWKEENLTPVSEEVRDDAKHRTKQEFIFMRDGKKFYYIVTLQEIRNLFNEVSGYFLTMSDITYQRVYEETIIKEANTDTLTKLYNRRYFYQYIESHAGTPMTLLYMDLDKFKYVNDTYGHAKGDEVLITAANTIKKSIEGATTARLGGDEFAAVILGTTDESDAKKYTGLIESKLKETFEAESLPVTVSIGITYYDGGELDIEKLIHEGDERMYEIKKMHHMERA